MLKCELALFARTAYGTSFWEDSWLRRVFCSLLRRQKIFTTTKLTALTSVASRCHVQSIKQLHDWKGETDFDLSITIVELIELWKIVRTDYIVHIKTAKYYYRRAALFSAIIYVDFYRRYGGNAFAVNDRHRIHAEAVCSQSGVDRKQMFLKQIFLSWSEEEQCIWKDWNRRVWAEWRKYVKCMLSRRHGSNRCEDRSNVLDAWR